MCFSNYLLFHYCTFFFPLFCFSFINVLSLSKISPFNLDLSDLVPFSELEPESTKVSLCQSFFMAAVLGQTQKLLETKSMLFKEK